MLLLVYRSITKACFSNCSNHYQINKKANPLSWKHYYNTREYLISFSRLPVSEAAKYSSMGLDKRNVHSFLCPQCLSSTICRKPRSQKINPFLSQICMCFLQQAPSVQKKLPLFKLKFPFFQSTFKSLTSVSVSHSVPELLCSPGLQENLCLDFAWRK